MNILSDVSNFSKLTSNDVCYPLALNYPLQYVKRPGNIIAVRR